MIEMPIPKTAKLGITGLITIVIAALILLPMAAAGKNSQAAENSEFTAKLPNGVTVELVGVCEHPNEGKKWWQPDGELLEQFPYEVKGRAIEPADGSQRRDLIVKIEVGQMKPAVKLIVSGATQSSVETNVKRENVNVAGFWSAGFKISSMLDDTDIKVGVASDDWQTVSKVLKDFQNPSTEIISIGNIKWLKSGEEKGEALIRVSYDFDDKADIRVVAVDVNGQTYQSFSGDCDGNATLMICENRFHVSLQKVKEFQFQIRPYQWVTFKNVSLKPDFKTNVQIDVQENIVGQVTKNTGQISNETKSEKIILLQDDGKSTGTESINGGGHGILFNAPSQGCKLTAVEIYGSRYGDDQPPEEDFFVYLCDEKFNVMQKFPFPYQRFTKGEPKWVTLKIEPVEVPATFVICLEFNPHQAKGVYVHYSGKSSGNSFIGKPGQRFIVFDRGDWMIKAIIEKPDVQRESVTGNLSGTTNFNYSNGRPKVLQIAFKHGDYKMLRSIPLSEVGSDNSKIPAEVLEQIYSHDIEFSQLVEDGKKLDIPRQLLLLEDVNDNLLVDLTLN